MKYLSDLLYITVDTAMFRNAYENYEVYMESPYIDSDSSILIFRGQVYKDGKKKTIYLNDIIQSYVYGNGYVDRSNPSDSKGSVEEIESGVLFNIKVVFPDILLTLYVESNPYIMNYYKDVKNVVHSNIQNLIEEGESLPIVYNLLLQRTNIFPRIPKLGYNTENFWLSALIAKTLSWKYKSSLDGDPVFTIAGTKNKVQHNYFNTYDCNSLINTISITGMDLYDIINHSDEIWYAGVQTFGDGSYRPDYTIATKIADIDECPADYYLIWIDRTGAYQCQPFNGKTTLTESFTNTYKYDLINKESPIVKTIDNKWTLNSGWLTYDEYKAYESIFTSKYLYLFNTKYDEGYEVILDTKQWTEKVKENKDKMFNLKLDVHSALKQNILY